MKLRKILAAVLALAITVTAFAACSSENGAVGETTTTTTAADGETATTLGEVEPLAVPEDLTTVVASVTTAADPDFFNITFSDFYNEYLFYLNRQGLDETAAENEATCAEYRLNIIQYQTLERVILKVAEENGVGISSLTADELTAIDESVQEAYKSWCESYAEEATPLLPEGYTDEDLYNKEFELFTAFLAKSNLTPEVFTTWERNSTIQQKLYDLVVKELTVSDEEIDEFIATKTQEAETAWENDLATYESSYTAFYIPEGTRVVEEIYFSVDSDTISEITAYRNDGDDATADQMVTDALAAIKTELDAAKKALDEGTDWDTVQATYNDDTNGNEQTYVVYSKSTTVPQEVIDSAMSIAQVGDYSEAISNDYGYYIYRYTQDKTMTEDDTAALRTQTSEYLLGNKQDALISEKVKEWQEKYEYEVNYDLIGVTTTAETTAADTTTA